VKILFVAAEVAPFVSVGGLSQVTYFLPRSLNKLGHDVRVFTPKYGSMKTQSASGNIWKLRMEYEGLKVPLNSNGSFDTKSDTPHLLCNIKSLYSKKRNLFTYFLENSEYYELRANVFGYMDDHTRFALLSKGCLEWLFQMKDYDKKAKDYWWPDVIHCHDWHTAYLIQLAKQDKRYQKMLAKTPVILTIHNLSYQGNYNFKYAGPNDRDDGTKPLASILSPQLQTQNALLRGILYADAITTVSSTYAVEVLAPPFSEGLEDSMQKVRGKIFGILNGLDRHEFNPATDTIIKQQYTEKTFYKARRENKLDLQWSFLLPRDVTRPLFAISGRICEQKGWDLLLEVLPRILEKRPDVQFIVLGSGEDKFCHKLQLLREKYPDQLGLHLRSDFRLPRKLFAGADIFLIPSVFEPGGIVALEALRYGAVPLVRRTGGLNDIIEDFNPATAKGNGFSFTQKDTWDLFSTMIEALTIYKQPALWKKLVVNCLESNFSWETSAIQYANLYEKVLEERKRAISTVPHPAYVASINP
jgi:starch synthase